jgi:NADH dehydrogenase
MRFQTRYGCGAGDDAAAAAKVILIEMADVIGPEFGDNPRPVIDTALGDAGVEQRLGCRVTRFEAGDVTLDGGERIDAATVVVTVGLRANGLTAKIPGDRDVLGRFEVGEDLKVAGLDDVYATGDVAHARVDDDGNYALMSCQHARTMGKYQGLNVVRDLRGETPQPDRQGGYSTCLDFGNFGVVFTTGWDWNVEKVGAEAKARKPMINTQWIYPPSGSAKEMVAALRINY